MFLSFLKWERHRKMNFFIPKRFSVPARTFLSVPDPTALQPFTVPDPEDERFKYISQIHQEMYRYWFKWKFLKYFKPIKTKPKIILTL